MIHDDHRGRMRQRFLHRGLEDFAPHEALELLLYYAIPRRDTNALAHRLIDRFGSFSAVLDAHPHELMQVEGMGESAAVFISALPQAWRMYRRDATRTTRPLTTSAEAGKYAIEHFIGKHREELVLFTLDTACRLIREHILYTGTRTEILLHVRTVVETALRDGAARVILAHNHPAGQTRPSQADMEMTGQIIMALSTVDINLADHIVVCGEEFLSMANAGILARLQKEARTCLHSLPQTPPALRQDITPYRHEGPQE